MTEAVSNTSPLLYLHQAGILEWLEQLFDAVWVPEAVADELEEGRRSGFQVPDVRKLTWLKIEKPRAIPPDWRSFDLGPGEIAAMALALEKSGSVVLLDDALARRVAEAAGLEVRGTLRVLLEGKEKGLADTIGPYIEQLRSSGMWISTDLERRVLSLAGELPE